MIRFFHKRLISLINAIKGWWYVIHTQKNAWFHAIASVVVIIVGFWLQLDVRDWSGIIIAIAIVWTAEFLNTALEIVVDLASPDLHPLARVGKDVGAAGVLIAAVSASIIGILIMGQPFISKVETIINNLLK